MSYWVLFDFSYLRKLTPTDGGIAFTYTNSLLKMLPIWGLRFVIFVLSLNEVLFTVCLKAMLP